MSDEIILYLCAAVTLFVLACAVAISVINRRDLKKTIRILGVAVFLMLVAVLYPYALKLDSSYALGLALAESMCAMLLNSSATDILSGFDAFAVAGIEAYKGMVLVLLIIAPLFTIGITLSFFSEKFTRIVYRITSEFKDSYIFSHINERTLAIAEDTYKNHKRAIILFAVRISEDDIDGEYIARMKKINAHIINEEPTEIKHSLRHTRNYYLLSRDGNENLELGLRLYNKYKDKPCGKVNMWLYSRDDLSEAIFDHLYETFNVRLINEERLVARNLLMDYPLYKSIRDGRLSILVVGAGYIGLEVLKVASVCSRLEGIEVEINAIDINGELARTRLEKMSPGLIGQCNIKFYSADINTSKFTEIIDSLSPTYVVVTLGNQNLDLETAVYIRRRYGLADGIPQVYALIDDKGVEREILPSLNVSDWSFNKETQRYESTFRCSFEIKTFGSYEETYSDLRIGASYKDCLAVAVTAQHRKITQLDDENTVELLFDVYNQVTYYKDYSDAFGLSVPYKLYMLGLELCDDGRGDVSLLDPIIKDNIDMLRKNENKRYEAFMRSKGWRQLLPEEIGPEGYLMDKLMKKHARLETTYQAQLEEMTGSDFNAKDSLALYNLPCIIKLANELSGRGFSVVRRDRS